MWRNLDELAGTEGFGRSLEGEFAQAALEYPDEVSRRNFLKIMGASMALAGAGGLAGCNRRPDRTIVPYVQQPQNLTPGEPLYFASAMAFAGFARGVLVKSHEGRPTKIEGNPDHPASLGSSDTFMQASILTLYDPQRSQVVSHLNDVVGWDRFRAAMKTRMDLKRQSRGAGLRILTESISSPTLADQLHDLLEEFPLARWHVFDAIDRDAARAGSILAYGKEISTIHRFEKANVILSLESDFLSDEAASVTYARRFADGRRVRETTRTINRLYAVQSTPTITGAAADHRFPVAASQVGAIVYALAQKLGIDAPPALASPAWLGPVVNDLMANRGAGIVIIGRYQPAHLHALVHAINQKLGNVGQTIVYTDPPQPNPEGATAGTLAELADDMESGKADTLFIVGGNPAYCAPADLDFAKRLEKFSAGNFSAYLSLYDDETSFLCQWHLPETHFLEQWSDLQGHDGTTSIVQPLIMPLYQGKSAHELLTMLIGKEEDISAYDTVRGRWQDAISSDFEATWRRALEKGVIEGTALEEKKVSLKPISIPPITAVAENVPGTDEYELIFRPDPSAWDGSFTNNAWMQELPRPLTHLTWDNAALMSPAAASRMGLSDGDVVQIIFKNRMIEAPILILPGQTDRSITLHLGYGRTRAGETGSGCGFNAYALRTSDSPWFGSGAIVRKTDRTHKLVTTGGHQTMQSRQLFGGAIKADVVAQAGNEKEMAMLDNRRLVRVATLDQFLAHPDFAKKLEPGEGTHLTLYPGYDETYKQNLAWGMSIDLNSCIGCNACAIACQAENNIMVVGRDEVERGREMHWIRIDTWFEGPVENPAVYFEPVTCMHCENAPCELVCPVAATVHDNEGINEMIYNRCVGTRYCSNNCPYKVRRFNYFTWGDQTSASLKLMRNPEVTVRTRGVMEKCTYCIQRVVQTRTGMEKVQTHMDEMARRAGGESERQEIETRSAQQRQQMLDELQTACQQACPTRAIVFGNINNAMNPVAGTVSEVRRLKSLPTNFGLLEELTTQPRTTYLARVTNPYAEIPPEAKA